MITAEQEAQLWEMGVAGTHSPEVLLNAIVFYNRKNFLLKRGR